VAKIPEVPTPKKLLKEAKAEAHQHPFDLLDYGEVIDTLFKKGFSFADIAKWLSARLEDAIKRGQIYYAYQVWLEKQETARVDKQLTAHEIFTAEDLLGNGPPDDPALEAMLQESHEAQLDAKAAREDSHRKRKKGKQK
jgi:hypothetical protein